MSATDRFEIIDEVPGLYRIIPFRVIRRTPGVVFDCIPLAAFPRIDALDHVIHQGGARSPGAVGDIESPWYMHTHQDDHLVVFHGTRHVDIYTKKHGKVESFVCRPAGVEKNGAVVHEGEAMLVWPRGVFHRIRSSEKDGSASLNFAVHYEGFDIRTNFNIYDLDTGTGECHVIRAGHLDQPGDV
jgi:hypothetical protein